MPTYRYRFTQAEVARVKALLREGVSPSAIAQRFNVTARTICYYKDIPTQRTTLSQRRQTKGLLTGTALIAPILRQTPPSDDDQLQGHGACTTQS